MAENNSIKVSVCCPAYNHELYIRQCLDSILIQQTTFKYEILVHDDASTDETARIINEYAIKYPELVKPVYQKTNQYSTRTRAIITTFLLPLAKGEYIAICEGDDYWCDPGKLQQQVNLLEKNPDYAMCYHDSYVLINGKVKKRYHPYAFSCIVPIRDTIIGKKYHCPTASIMFRKELIENYPGYCLNCHIGDYALRVFLALQNKLFYINKCMSVYRHRHSQSWSIAQEDISYTTYINQLQTQKDLLEGIDKLTNHVYHHYITEADIHNEINRCFRWKKFNELTYTKFKERLLIVPWQYRLKLIMRIYIHPKRLKFILFRLKSSLKLIP